MDKPGPSRQTLIYLLAGLDVADPLCAPLPPFTTAVRPPGAHWLCRPLVRLGRG